jgi:hypothetical protein
MKYWRHVLVKRVRIFEKWWVPEVSPVSMRVFHPKHDTQAPKPQLRWGERGEEFPVRHAFTGPKTATQEVTQPSPRRGL